MFHIGNWKMPIYKDDVRNVVLYGLIYSILAGILAGSLDFLFGKLWRIPISFGLIVLSVIIGTQVRRGYRSYHILYPVLTIVFMILGLIVSDFVYIFYHFPTISTFKCFIQWSFYWYVIEGSIDYILLCFRNFRIEYLIMGIAEVLVYGFSFCFCYRLAKGRN